MVNNRTENFNPGTSQNDNSISRRDFLKASIGMATALELGTQTLQAKKRDSNSEKTPEQLELEKRISAYGLTGERLPLSIKHCIKNMPEGCSLNSYQVVLVTDYEKYLDATGVPKDPQVRRLSHLRVAETEDGKFPIFINGEIDSTKSLLKDPEGLEVIKGFLIHERLHAVSPICVTVKFIKFNMSI